MTPAADTIAAIATPAGRGAIGIVRVSGPRSADIGRAVLGRLPAPRRATLAQFRGTDGHAIDVGLALRFSAPASYTGEDMLELHCHGGTVITGLLLKRVLDAGARPARPGEFTERAFLNGRLDLLQAEAVADLIDSQSEQAARCAVLALAGEFSHRIRGLHEGLTTLRVLAEGSLDFPDEEAGSATGAELLAALQRWQPALESLRASARTGHALRRGLRIVIAGAPNAGKSSLLNRLVGAERAIVDAVPGTTRDLVEGELELGSLRASVVDTAGVRAVDEAVEREGVRRTLAALQRADIVILVDAPGAPLPPELPGHASAAGACIHVRNKIDLDGTAPMARAGADGWQVALSARTGAGIDGLLQILARATGADSAGEDVLLARTRHLQALDHCADAACRAADALRTRAGVELAAEELRLAQDALGTITGAVGADALLGEIFARFCIGK